MRLLIASSGHIWLHTVNKLTAAYFWTTISMLDQLNKCLTVGHQGVLTSLHK